MQRPTYQNNLENKGYLSPQFILTLYPTQHNLGRVEDVPFLFFDPKYTKKTIIFSENRVP